MVEWLLFTATPSPATATVESGDDPTVDCSIRGVIRGRWSRRVFRMPFAGGAR